MRIDCCLTYRGFTDSHDPTLSSGELTTEEWKTLLSRLFNAGIPHVILFGGEPTLRADLTELMAFTEQLGLVSGLVSSDPKLTDPGYLLPLIEAGLDHLTYYMDPSTTENVLSLSNILDQDLFTCLRLPIQPNRDYHDLIHKLQEMGANVLILPEDMTSRPSLNTSRTSLKWSRLVDDTLSPIIPIPRKCFNVWDPDHSQRSIL